MRFPRMFFLNIYFVSMTYCISLLIFFFVVTFNIFSNIVENTLTWFIIVSYIQSSRTLFFHIAIFQPSYVITIQQHNELSIPRSQNFSCHLDYSYKSGNVDPIHYKDVRRSSNHPSWSNKELYLQDRRTKCST